MKKFSLLFLFLFLNCASYQEKNTNIEISNIHLFLNDWHQAAGQANFKAYFDAMSEDAVYIGTDASENWNKKEFMKFATPYFEKGKAWNFKCLKRNIYFSSDQKTVWFDELLDTQMKICRGSGILILDQNGKWKIKHYVLSMTVPNENTTEVVKIKSVSENQIIEHLLNK